MILTVSSDISLVKKAKVHAVYLFIYASVCFRKINDNVIMSSWGFSAITESSNVLLKIFTQKQRKEKETE